MVFLALHVGRIAPGLLDAENGIGFRADGFDVHGEEGLLHEGIGVGSCMRSGYSSALMSPSKLF